jgi:hypothetical protein
MADLTPYQQKIVKRFYRNYDAIQVQRLSELATELFLAEGKAKERLWVRVEQILTKLEFPAARVNHLMARRDPSLLPGILKELETGH